VKIEQEIDLPAPIDRVWAFFDDVPRVASCMPGATLSEIVDDTTFDGNVALKIGPIAVNYQGRLLIEGKDDASHTIHLKANGKDRKGAGSANAKIVATLTELDPASTRLAVDSDVQLTGRIASLGRGVQDVAGKLFVEFGERMSADITAEQAAAHEPATQAPAEEMPPAHDASAAATTSGAAAASAGADSGADKPAARTSTAPVARTNEPIKVGSLLWSILRDKIASLFRRLRGRR
jgi:carbon monoxide dehydrogenase subunit G